MVSLSTLPHTLRYRVYPGTRLGAPGFQFQGVDPPKIGGEGSGKGLN